MNKKVAIITGITGQDGAYLAEFLLKKGYIVHGIKRRTSLFNTQRIDKIFDNEKYKNLFFLHFGDLTDSLNLANLINKILPDEIYNLGAMSHVKVSFDIPEYTSNSDGLGALRILEIIKMLKGRKEIKFYQASTSELYGKVQEIPQKESTPFYPRSPYAVSKQFAYWMTINYREAYDIFACNGILFNHESPLRGETFVTRKITRAIAKMNCGLDTSLVLGNLNAKRDWGHAKDYVEAMWLMLQIDKPEDFVIATGTTTSIRDFCIIAFESIGIKIDFIGNDIDEKGIVKDNGGHEFIKNGQVVIKVSKKYFRPTEVDLLIGDASKAKEKLNWTPKISLRDLIDEMVENDIEIFNKFK